MAVDRPTIAEILARVQGDFRANLPDFDPYLARSELYAELAAMSAGMHVLNGRILGVARNHFIDQCDEEHLARAGDQIGEPRSYAQQAGPGSAQYSGVDSTYIASGTYHVNANGVRFQQLGGATVSGGTVTVSLIAVEAGSDGNMALSTAIELEEPIDGITAGSGAITLALEGGTDDQAVEDYRAEVQDRWSFRGQGGSVRDFLRWMRESGPGLWTRIFLVRPATGSNLINMYAVDDSQDPDGNLITRATADYDDAEDWIKQDHIRPLCADLHVQAPTLMNLNPAITLTPNTTAVQAAVKEEIIRLLIRDFPGPDGIAGTLYKSHLDEAISRAAGEITHTTTSPTGDVAYGAGELPVIGTPVFS